MLKLACNWNMGDCTESWGLIARRNSKGLFGPASCLQADGYLTKLVLLLKNRETETSNSYLECYFQYLPPTLKIPTF